MLLLQLSGFSCAFQPSRPGFESQVHHLRFYQFLLICVMWKKRKINKKEAGLSHLKKFRVAKLRWNDAAAALLFKTAANHQLLDFNRFLITRSAVFSTGWKMLTNQSRMTSTSVWPFRPLSVPPGPPPAALPPILHDSSSP